MQKVLVVGVAGGSGSGKTTLTKSLTDRFGDDIAVIHHDDYYRANDDLTYEERTQLNYDCPDSFETEMMAEHLRLLKEGRSIYCPVYDYTVYNRSNKTVLIEPRPIIIAEGIMIFAEPLLVEQMDIKIFVDTDADIRLCRRVVRDVSERRRTVESVTRQWLATVKPMHDRYVEPSKKNADIIVPEGGENKVAVDMITLFIERQLGASCGR